MDPVAGGDTVIFEPEADAHTVWQVKAATLCDLRCRYCYEWDRLSDRGRMTRDQWRRVFESAADYRDIRRRRHGIASRVVFMWHGGEPLLLPPAYVRDVLALQADVFAGHAPAGSHCNAVQTNLARANETLEVMASAGFIVSASLDFAAGARVDAAGRDSHARALANLERLLARSVRCGVTVVLGRHNRDRLVAIHDALDRLGAAWLRIVPMFAPPAGAPGGDLGLDVDETVAALAGLFAHRLRRGARIRVHPLEQALQAVIGRRAGVVTTLRDRRRQGETRLVVHPDGTLTAQGGSARPDSVIGNVFTQRAREIFASLAYRSSLDRDDALRARHCPGCRYRGTCDSRPLFAQPHDLPPGPCPVDSRLMEALDAQIARAAAPRRRPYCAAAVSMPSPRKPPDWRSHSLA